jgi:deazaflavin-dependent oxidoreductase (nitroreductase family)
MNASAESLRDKMSKQNDWNKQVIEEFRANKGKVGGFFKNMSLLLLHTTGAKSGEPRLNPVAYMREGDQYVIIASKGGAPTHPAWYYNVVAHPEVSIEVGTETVRARAEVVPEPQRSELYARMAAMYPGFAEYERKTDRIIPVITLSRLL